MALLGRAGSVVLPFALVALMACSADDGAVGSDGSLFTDADRAVTPTPAVVPPGGLVSLRFSDEDASRGVSWRLSPTGDVDGNDGPFVLIAGAGGYDSPSILAWYEADESYGVDDIGISGLGPDVVRIPEVAGAGEWELCNGAGGNETYCSSVSVDGEPVPADDLQVAVTSDPVAPDERFDLVSPPGSVRPTAWRLQREQDLGRANGFVLYPYRDGRGPSWRPAEDVDGFTADAVVGPGPDVLVVPAEAEEGAWLVCAPGEEEAARCAHLEVQPAS